MISITTRAKGNLGEDIACKFLTGRGFVIRERNYRKNWGELDIIAERDGMIHFFEVKSASGSFGGGHKPEDNVDDWKIMHIRRMVRTYFAENEARNENGRGVEDEFQFHILCVYMNEKTRLARVKWLKNIIL